jgi:DivIVA domain-containing protein
MERLQPEDIENQLFPIAMRGYEKEKVDAFLRVVAAYYREAIRAGEEIARAAASPSHPYEALGDQIATILGTAAVAADDLKLQADREAQKMRGIAAAEAAEVTREATNQLMIARQMKSDAQQEAEVLRAEVGEELAKLQHDARDRVARLEQEARQRIGKMEETARMRVETFLEEGRRRYDQLRGAEEESAASLRGIESLLRKAREALTADQSTSVIGAVLAGSGGPPPDRNRSANGTDRRTGPGARPSEDAGRSGEDGAERVILPRPRRQGAIEASARFSTPQQTG